MQGSAVVSSQKGDEKREGVEGSLCFMVLEGFFIKLLLSPALRWLLVPLLHLRSCSVHPRGGPGLQRALWKHQIQRTDPFPPIYVEGEK